MKGVVLILISVLCNSILTAQNSPSWLRYPALSPDGKTIVFAYHGDLYTVPASGGTAKLLVQLNGQELMPVWSKDGKHVCFAGNRSGNFDLYIVPAKGGEAKQLTWHAADEFPSDFTTDGNAVVFSAARMDAPECRQFPSESLPELYTVPAAGGRVKQLLTTPAEDAKLSADENIIIYHDRKARENPWRKHQVSSAARDIWVYDQQTDTHRQLSEFTGEDRSPVFSNDQQTIFYLSERSGSFNVFQSSISGKDEPKQLTFFKDHPIRFLSIAKSNTLCFGYDGEIWIKKNNAAPKKVLIRIRASPQQSLKQVSITEASEIAVSPSGKEMAFIARGEVFVSNILGKDVRRITTTPGEEAGLSFAPDGNSLLYASENSGNWKIMQAAMPTGKNFYGARQIVEKELIGNDQENYQPAWSPDGKEIAFIANRNTLRVYNIATGKSREILSAEQLVSRRDHDQYFEWSPDSHWLLVQFSEQGAGNDEVGIIDASGNGRLINLTKSGFNEARPKWMMNGKMVLFSGDRFGLHSFDNSGTAQTDIFALFPDEKDWRNFNEIKQADASVPSADTLNVKSATNGPTASWERINERKLRLTNASAILSDAVLSDDGKTLFYLAKLEKNYDLWQIDLRTKETKRLLQLKVPGGSLQWDKEQKWLYLLADGDVIRIDPATASQQKVNIKTEISIDPAKERAAMFDHVWRRTAQTFYTAGYHGANWEQFGIDYRKYLSGIDNNFDFAEMLNELLGELNVSHTGAAFNNKRKDIEITGSLGIFYDQQYEGAGMKIGELISNSPLSRSDLEVKPGDIIISVDGSTIEADKDIDFYLTGKSGKQINLQVKGGGKVRNITVTALTPSEEADLLYKRWVERNRLETEKSTNGEWGYVHLYRMNDAAYRNVYEEILSRYNHCKGIIVDTRFNRGGDLAPELITFLSGTRTRTNTNDHFLAGIEPGFRWTKPSLVLAGESNYSDGHCFVYDYQYLHMGKLIGMPVPGSCTWMTGQTLLDPTLSFSVPTMGVKTNGGKYLENYQTEPDIRVMNEYGKVSRGQDQQLEEAIRQSKLSANDR
ncbi:S41 family peptidase [Pseudobacter ginsenosidimutans]|nr:S41 family peptidase [Pseudobacter ginsenosidimutans]QEC40384.1 PDZ domain-containing protein [Pseudobacter ginsenosidimutans]